MSWDPLNEPPWGLEQPGCSPGSHPVAPHKGSGGCFLQAKAVGLDQQQFDCINRNYRSFQMHVKPLGCPRMEGAGSG